MALGEASLNAIDQHRRASLGYWLHPAGRGRGLTTRAARLLTRWGFDELHLVRIELTCGPENDASQVVARRLGFTFEGRLRSHWTLHGRPRDTLVHSLLPTDPV